MHTNPRRTQNSKPKPRRGTPAYAGKWSPRLGNPELPPNVNFDSPHLMHLTLNRGQSIKVRLACTGAVIHVSFPLNGPPLAQVLPGPGLSSSTFTFPLPQALLDLEKEIA